MLGVLGRFRSDRPTRQEAYVSQVSVVDGGEIGSTHQAEVRTTTRLDTARYAGQLINCRKRQRCRGHAPRGVIHKIPEGSSPQVAYGPDVATERANEFCGTGETIYPSLTRREQVGMKRPSG